MPGGDKKSALRGHNPSDADIDQIIESALTKQAETFEKLLTVQAETYKQCLQCFIDNTNSRIDKFVKDTTKELCEIKSSLEYTQREVDEIKSTVKTSTSNATTVTNRLEKAQQDIIDLTQETDYLESQSRRNNLRIDGIPESSNESWAETETCVRDVQHTKLQMAKETVDSIEIERAHRTGRKNYPDSRSNEGKKPRTIVIKLTKFKDRELILKQAKEVRHRGLYVNEDFTRRVMDKRKGLIPEMMQARQEGKIAFLSYDRLVVKERTVRADS